MMSKNQQYLTKRLLINQTRKAFIEASENALEVAGYLLIAEDNKLIKLFPDGSKEIIKKLSESKKLAAIDR